MEMQELSLEKFEEASEIVKKVFFRNTPVTISDKNTKEGSLPKCVK